MIMDSSKKLKPTTLTSKKPNTMLGKPVSEIELPVLKLILPKPNIHLIMFYTQEKQSLKPKLKEMNN